MPDQPWTPSRVAERMEEAAATLQRLPAPRVRGYFSTWPPIVRDAWEAFGWEQTQVRLGPPSAEAIDRMDEALGWLHWLEADAARLVWLRACRLPWKAFIRRMRMGRTKAWQEWVMALAIIAARLTPAGQVIEKPSIICSNKKLANTASRI
jgi:hypothetical protein